MLNAIYKNETNVIFSLKLNDEAAHGKFLVSSRRGTVRQSGWPSKVQGLEIGTVLKKKTIQRWNSRQFLFVCVRSFRAKTAFFWIERPL